MIAFPMIPSGFHRPHVLAVAALLATLGGCDATTDDGGSCPPADPVVPVGLRASAHLRDENAVPVAELPPPPGPDEPVGPPPETSPWKVVGLDETVPIDEYAFAVTAEAVRAEGRRARAAPWYGFLIGNAQALSCAPPGLWSTSSLAGLTLTSDRALGPDLPAGTDLADVARIDARPRTGTDYATGTARVPQLLEFGRFAGDLRLSDWLDDSPVAPLQFAVRLDATPQAPETHVLTVTYLLDGGNTFSLVSDPVVLGPGS